MDRSHTDLLADAEDLAADLTDLRHRVHEHPELGLELPHTQRAVLAELDGAGLEITTGTSCSSVIAILRGGAVSEATESDEDARRPVVLLRADMDALPITERTDVPYRSRVDGLMHACGHDLHTAMLVGAARLLVARRPWIPGDIVLMFQPGEEGFDGAGRMIAEGVLDAAGRRPDAALALHVLSNLAPRSTVATRPGPFMAASDALTVTIRGEGGHAATPRTVRNPIPAACEMVLALKRAMSRRIDPETLAVLTVGTLHAGSRRNVIPETATFEATIRTFDPQVSAQIRDLAQRVCLGVGTAHDIRVDLGYTPEYPVTVNDPVETQFALAVAEAIVGTNRILQLPEPIAGSEDFSRILAEVPGVMLFLGATPDGVDPDNAPANHSPQAVFDDAVLPTGAALFVAWALARLNEAAKNRERGPRPRPGQNR